MKRNVINLFLGVVASAVLGACGGGGGSSDSSSPVGGSSPSTTTKTYKVSDFAGIWRGTASAVPGVEATGVIRADGSYWGVAYNPTTNILSVGVGTATVESNTLVIKGLSYVGVEGSPATQAEARLQGTPGVSISGTSTVVGTSASGSIQYSYDKTASSAVKTVADVAGTWTGAVVGNGGATQVSTLTVSSSGNVALLLDTGCTAAGQITSTGGPTLDVQISYSATNCNRPRTERGVINADATKGGIILSSNDKLVGGFMVLSRR